jgi:bifunctional non-homologous end joining protein LigD
MIIPMVARLVPTPFDREGWLFEIKWDGFRAIAEKDQTGTVLYSRNHRDFTKRFPPIVQAVSALKDNVILDGEIVALDDRGHARFEWLVNRGPQKGILIYHVFDLLQLGSTDLRNEPLSKRKQQLQDVLKGHNRLQYVEQPSRIPGRAALRRTPDTRHDQSSHA